MPPRHARWTPAAILVIAGSTYSIAGGPFDATLELASLDGANGFVLNGIDDGDDSGRSVSGAGDVNGDGIDDLIIGAFAADPNGSRSGESYVVFGAAGIGAGGAVELSALNGANGFVINGVDSFDYSGRSVSGAGDINGDGVDDLVIGARYADSNMNGYAGESYVVFGGAGIGAGGAIELSALNGANGFVINGIDLDDLSGGSVSGAGDINGDGVDDLIIGARNADPNGNSIAGESYVIFGGAGVGAGGAIELSALNGANGFVCNGIDPSDRSGVSVSAAGDVNGDGVDDLIIGAYHADPNGISNAGESYVVFGGAGVGAGGAIELSALNGSTGFVINGINAHDQSGISVSGAGDINGDGVDDLIIGAASADPNGNADAGESYVVFGGAGVGAGGAIELSALNGADGFVLSGNNANFLSGGSVSGAGDINGDGVDDLVIGASKADPNGNAYAGESYLVFGGDGIGAGGVRSLAFLDQEFGNTGDHGVVIHGIDASDSSGISVSGAGDINGDGVDDLIIGAFTADPNGNDAAGESYVVFGKSASTPIPGDINGDGIVDAADLGILIGNFGLTGP